MYKDLYVDEKSIKRGFREEGSYCPWDYGAVKVYQRFPLCCSSFMMSRYPGTMDSSLLCLFSAGWCVLLRSALFLVRSLPVEVAGHEQDGRARVSSKRASLQTAECAAPLRITINVCYKLVETAGIYCIVLQQLYFDGHSNGFYLQSSADSRGTFVMIIVDALPNPPLIVNAYTLC